jgi:type I restriction enzyme M protein
MPVFKQVAFDPSVIEPPRRVRGRRGQRDGAVPLTTAQRLGSIVKSARDIMRKDKGLNGDLDRLPMLTWVMFLKFLDDTEQLREDEATLAGERFRPAIESPYRWRDWAARKDGITGNELIAFVNQDEAVRPDGTRGLGLFAYLRSLQGAEGGDRRDVIATVFRGITNRMINGYLLRDVINRVAEIHFSSSDELHTLGNLYESMLREMRDAAGDSGEFYTPRPVVRFMVAVVDPRLGETVLDPACGTGGFLVEAYKHLVGQCRTVEERETLQRRSLFGVEPKPLPYLLAQMNLLLHGLESPRIDPGNALRFRLNEIGDRERVDVVLTNPPFGGEEEAGIQGNFPQDKRTGETALLFLQLIMRKLRRQPKPGLAAMVAPNGKLFGGGVAARIKEELLKEFNLHTIVRLPNGVFAPYTSIPTNVLFFDRSGPTREVWYYEQPLPEGRKQYTKTQPIQFEELNDCLAWWKERQENERAWKVPAAEILANGCNLDLKNPHAKQDLEHLPPEELAESILQKELRIAEIMREIKGMLAGAGR